MRKRIISLVLIATLLLSLFAFAEESDKTVTIAPYTEEMNLIKAINIIPDGLNPDDVITRGRFAKMIVDLLFKDIEILFELETEFSDLDFSKEYYNSVLVLEKLNIVSGNGSGKFSPDEIISFQDGIVMLIKALGYNLYADDMGGYPTGYYMAAKKIGVLNGIQNQEKLDYRTASKLIYNTLFVAPVSYNTVTDRGLQATINNRIDILFETLKIKKLKGQLVDDGIASFENSSVQYKTITLKDSENKSVFILRNEKDVSEFLGCNVNAFCKLNEGETYELVFISLDDNVNSLIINAKDISNVYGDLSCIEYFIDKEASDVKKAKITADSPAFFENGFKLSQVGKEDIWVNDGFIKLIDNNNDNVFDVVIITSVTSNIIASSLSGNNTSLICKYTPVNSIDLSDKSTTAYRIFKDNYSISLADIKENDVVSVAPSKYKKDGVQIYYLYVSDLKEEIKVSSKNEELKTIYSNDKEYTVSPSFYKANNKILKIINPGNTYNIYINAFGDIAYVENLEASGIEYAYILNVSQSNQFADVKLAMYTRYNTLSLSSVSPNVIIDGKRLDSKLINGESSTMLNEIRELLSVRSDGEVYIRSSSESSEYNQSHTSITPRLAIVKVNQKGEVYYIDTDAISYENDDKLEAEDPFVLTAGERKCRTSQMSVNTTNAVALPSDGSFIVDSSTYIISVPDIDRYEIEKASGTYGYSIANTNKYEMNLFDLANYRTPSVTDLKRAHYYDLQPYNIDKDTGVASVLLLRGHNDWGDAVYNENAKNYVVFKKLTKYYNPSLPDADYYKLYYVTLAGTEGSILVDKDYIQEDFKNIIFGGTSVDTAGNTHTVNKLTPGDVIYFTNDDRSLVNIVRLLNVKRINEQTLSTNGANSKAARYYSGAQANVIPFDVKTGAAAQISYSSTYSYDLAIANQLSEMSVSIWQPAISSSGYLAPFNSYYDGTADVEKISYLHAKSLIEGNILVVEETSCGYPSGYCITNIRKGRLDDIKFLENDPDKKIENASKLFFYKTTGTPSNMVIYNLKSTHR